MLIWKTSSHIRAIHVWYGCQHPTWTFLHAITSSIRLACYPNGLRWHSRWVPRQGSQLHPHTFVGQRFIESHRAKISKSSPKIPTFAPYNTHHLCCPKVQVLCFASSVQCQMRRPETVGWSDGNKIRAKLARLSLGTTGSMPSLLCINCRTSKISKMSCSETCLDIPWSLIT